MKRCGQWLFVLWVAAALLYPQAATAVSRTRSQTCQLSQSQAQSLPLLADCSFKETGKVDAKPDTTPDNSGQIHGGGAQNADLPAIADISQGYDTRVQPEIGAARGRLPFVCGPPVLG